MTDETATMPATQHTRPDRKQASDDATANAAREPNAKRLGKQRTWFSVGWSKAMRLTRRIHLYSGLFMFPWVMLYAVSAFLFNHPTYFPDTTTHVFGPAHRESEPFGGLPSAQTTAAEIVAQLNDQNGASRNSAEYRLAPSRYAEFTRSAFASIKTEDAEYTVILTGTDGRGFIRVKPVEKDDSRPSLPDVNLASTGELEDKLNSGLRTKLSEMGVEQDGASFRGLPELQFDLAVDGEVHRVRYNATRGTLAVVEPSSVRRFLLRLHMAHMYPSEHNTRWFWAIAVDAMFATMMFWGLSGILMWWQLRKTRLLGGIIVTASAIVATWLAIGMHGVLAG